MEVFEEFQKTLVVIRSQLFIHIIGGGTKGVESSRSDTSSAYASAVQWGKKIAEPSAFYLILRRLADMKKTIYPTSREG